MQGIKTPFNFSEPSQYSKIRETTKWQMVSPLEYYVSCRAVDSTAKWEDLNSCAICMCELWEDLPDEKDDAKMLKNMVKEQQKLSGSIGDAKFL